MRQQRQRQPQHTPPSPTRSEEYARGTRFNLVPQDKSQEEHRSPPYGTNSVQNMGVVRVCPQAPDSLQENGCTPDTTTPEKKTPARKRPESCIIQIESPTESDEDIRGSQFSLVPQDEFPEYFSPPYATNSVQNRGVVRVCIQAPVPLQENSVSPEKKTPQYYPCISPLEDVELGLPPEFHHHRTKRSAGTQLAKCRPSDVRLLRRGSSRRPSWSTLLKLLRAKRRSLSSRHKHTHRDFW